ncbi:outer membrane protein [Tropicibacter oceani]|uniref:Porin family protein n=1 Tax=Tropicibacter oceani TaxID=3058420 RepID=A0ABY8QG53_9RHOB|nr:porin family protein [Tropicibacter oceani]WGW02988.1 porin family protein [Tropicibacter oceani]
MKRMIALTAAATVMGGAAFAGSMQDPVVEPVPAQPVAVTVQPGGDWTGPYAGLSFGNLDATAGALDEDGMVYGVFGGYDYDFGQFVMGAELDYQATDDFSLGGVDVDDVWRLKLRGGYDAGPALLYVTAGGAKANTSIGDAEGAVYGLGMDYKVTERFTVGAEYLRHDFNDVGNTNVDVEADTISLRGALRF